MKDGYFIVGMILMLGLLAATFMVIGNAIGKEQSFNRCFEHFNYLTVVEARANCNNILKEK